MNTPNKHRFMLLLPSLVVIVVICYACYTPESNVKSTSSVPAATESPILNDPIKHPYSERNWQQTYETNKGLLQKAEDLRQYIKELGLEKRVEDISTLLNGKMKSVTIDKIITLEDFKNYSKDSTIRLGAYHYYSKSAHDETERLLIRLALMGMTAEKIQSVYDKYNFNIFRNSPRTPETINQEPLVKETFSQTIIVGEFENIQSDVSPKDGFLSSITIKVHSVLKGSVHNNEKIIIRGYSGTEPDGWGTFYSHSVENFRYVPGLKQIFYLSHDLYLSEIAVPTGYSSRKYIDRHANINRQNYYKCLFSPTELPSSNGEWEKNDKVIKCREIAKMLQ